MRPHTADRESSFLSLAALLQHVKHYPGPAAHVCPLATASAHTLTTFDHAVGQGAARSCSPASDGAAASFNCNKAGRAGEQAGAQGPPTPSPAKRTTRPRQPRGRALFTVRSCDDGLLGPPQPGSQDSADPGDADWTASEEEADEEEGTYIRKSRRNSRSLHRRVASVPGAMQLGAEGACPPVWHVCLHAEALNMAAHSCVSISMQASILLPQHAPGRTSLRLIRACHADTRRPSLHHKAKQSRACC